MVHKVYIVMWSLDNRYPSRYHTILIFWETTPENFPTNFVQIPKQIEKEKKMPKVALLSLGYT